MENQTQILVICTHEGIMATILRLINNNPAWHATGAPGIAGAENELGKQVYDLMLLGNGLSPEEESKMISFAKTKSNSIKIIQHFGGGSGLLFAEIYEALAGR